MTVFDKIGLEEIIKNAVDAAFKRSLELGKD
ncbi:MAG: hypothetical protein ACTSRA_16960 [Promethearchaeota archaeon]